MSQNTGGSRRGSKLESTPKLLQTHAWDVRSRLGAGSGEVGEWRAGVGQAVAINPRVGRDQGTNVVLDVPDIDVHARGDAALAQPERDELAGGDVATHHDVVVATSEPRVLHPDVVLVGEEVRDRVERLAAAEHRLGDRRALDTRVLPVLDADPAV